MKKNLFFGLCAASMLLMTSCDKDGAFANLFQGEEGPVTVKMSVALPEMQNATRAAEQFGNGYSAQKLNYAVYEIITEMSNAVDENGKPIYNDVDTVFLAAQEVRDVDMMGQISKTVALKLMPGSTYEVVFWAQHHDKDNDIAPYTCTFNKLVGDGVVAEVTLDYNKIYTNNEINDAFWGKTRINNVQLDGASVIDLGEVKLNRPFAQLNIGTADLAAATAAGYPVDKVEVVIPEGVCDVLNLWNGEATHSNKDAQGRTFKKNVIVDPELYAFPIASYKEGDEDKPLQHMAMNYLLVNTDKTTHSVTLNYFAGERSKSRTFNNVPAQRNYRTNIYGELLTSDMQVEVTIDPIFTDSYNGNGENGTFPQPEAPKE